MIVRNGNKSWLWMLLSDGTACWCWWPEDARMQARLLDFMLGHAPTTVKH